MQQPEPSSEAKIDEQATNLFFEVLADKNYSSTNQYIINQFLISGMDINKVYRQTTTLLAAIQAENLELVRWLIMQRADVNLRPNNYPPLYYAVGKIKDPVIAEAIIKELLQNGAKPQSVVFTESLLDHTMRGPKKIAQLLHSAVQAQEKSDEIRTLLLQKCMT